MDGYVTMIKKCAHIGLTLITKAGETNAWCSEQGSESCELSVQMKIVLFGESAIGQNGFIRVYEAC